MEIRSMTMEDYGAVYALWLSCPGMGLNSVDDSREGIQKFLRRNPDTCFVAVGNGAIVGVILAGNDGRRGYLHHTAVSPQYRHMGIGTKLVERAIQGLADLGITKVALVVFERNEGGNAFWEKQGFSLREDLVYRNKTLAEMERIET